jgi:hypothetical protein
LPKKPLQAAQKDPEARRAKIRSFDFAQDRLSMTDVKYLSLFF